MALDEKWIKDMQAHISNEKLLEGENLAKADYNKDGKVSVKDVSTYMKQGNSSDPVYKAAAQKVDNDAAKATASTQTPATQIATSQPSQVDSAMQKIDGELSSNNKSNWQDKIDSTMSAIENKKPFTYDLNGDILYHQYADQYGRNAEKAMKNTVGQVSALSGGYGNSYAQTAGQQTYADTMSGLNDVVPELYNLALNKYNQEQQDLKDMLSIYKGMEESEYGRYIDKRNFDYQQGRDAVADEQWQTAFDYQQGRDAVADSQWRESFDYQKLIDDKNFNESVRQFDERMEFDKASFDEQVRQFNKTFTQEEQVFLYERGLQKIMMDKQPNNAECLALGVTKEGAQEMRKKYKKMLESSVSKGGGSGYSGYSGYSSGYSNTQIKQMFKDGDYGTMMNALVSKGGNIYTNAQKCGISKHEIDYINDDGKITSLEQASYLLNNYKKANTPSSVNVNNMMSEGHFYATSNNTKYNTYADYLTGELGKYIDWSV